MAQTQNRVVGSGKLYFDKFLPGTQTKTGERYIGNTPTLTENASYQNLDHFDSDNGHSTKDDSYQLRADRGGSFSCDNVVMENVALIFGSDDPTSITVAGATGLAETIGVTLGRYYQLGSAITPAGVSNVSNVVVTDATGLHAFGSITVAANPSNNDTITINSHVITFVTGSPTTHQVQIGANVVITAQNLEAEINAYSSLYAMTGSGQENIVSLRANATGTGGNALTLAKSGTNPTLSGATLSGGSASGTVAATGNYEVDTDLGRLHIFDDAADIATGDTLEVTYNVGLATRTMVIDSETQVEGAMRFIANNAKGINKDRYWPRVKLVPSGDYALKGETWQTMTFNYEVLEPLDGATKRVYVTERP